MPSTKILSKEKIFQSKHFFVERVSIERNGQKFTKEIIEKMPVVNIIPYTKDNEIFLAKEYRDAYGKVMHEVIGGKMDNDNPLEAAKRELREETGLSAKLWRQVAIYDLSMSIRQKIYVFIATGLDHGEAELDVDEIIEIVKMPIEQAIKAIEKGEVTESSSVASLLLFDKLKKDGKI